MAHCSAVLPEVLAAHHVAAEDMPEAGLLAVAVCIRYDPK
jgi:hypothetical protein